MGPMQIQQQVKCDKCQGRGYRAKAQCPHCKGKQLVDGPKELKIEIEKGMPNGHEVVFKGAGEQHPDMMPGNVVFKLKTNRHPYFTRRGNNLYMKMEITLKEALLGFTKEIKHLDGHIVKLTSKSITKPSEVKVIKSEGMPHHNTPQDLGDLHIEFKVVFPKEISDKQKKAVQLL